MTSSTSTENSRPLKPCTAIFLANLFFFLPFLFGGEAGTIGAGTGDLPIYFKPMREFAALELARGNFPFWNPYSSGGHPFLADPESGLLYPFNYLFVLLPSNLAFSWSYFIHYLIAGYGMFFLCHRLGVSNSGAVAGTFTFLFAAPHLLHLYAGHFTMITTFAWTPWMLWSMECFLTSIRWRYAAWFGLFLGLHLLGGFAMYTYAMGWVIFAYSLYRGFSGKLFRYFFKIVAPLGCALVLAVGVFFTQLNLAVELMENSTRKDNDFAFVSSYTIGKENLITLLAPKIYGENADLETNERTYFGKSIFWENIAYLGVISLLLALSALLGWESSSIKFWFSVLLVSFLIALGPLTPLFKLCYDYLPGFSLFRGYSKILSISSLAVGILAGKGLDILARRPGNIWIKIWTCAIPLLLFVLMLASPDSLPYWKELLLQKLFAWGIGSNEERIAAYRQLAQSSLLVSALFATGVAAVYGLRESTAPLRRHFSFAICLLIFAEFFVYAHPYFDPLDLKTFAVSDDLIRPILNEPAQARVFHDNSLIANLTLAKGAASVGGFENFALKDYSRLANYFNETPMDTKNPYLIVSPTGQNMNFYAAAYILSRAIPSPPFPLKTLASGEIANNRYFLYKRDNVLPRFNTAHKIKPFPDSPDKLAEKPDLFAATAQAMLREYPDTAFMSPETFRRVFPKNVVAATPYGAEERIHVLLQESDRTFLDVDMISNGLLVIAENYYPGWHARIDGKEADLFPVNMIMKAIAVPLGKHKVEVYFIPTNFYRSITLSLASFIILVGIVLFDPKSHFTQEQR